VALHPFAGEEGVVYGTVNIEVPNFRCPFNGNAKIIGIACLLSGDHYNGKEERKDVPT
jgi:hypothetical protein